MSEDLVIEGHERLSVDLPDSKRGRSTIDLSDVDVSGDEDQGGSIVPKLLIGLAIGAAAVVVYTQRSKIQGWLSRLQEGTGVSGGSDRVVVAGGTGTSPLPEGGETLVAASTTRGTAPQPHLVATVKSGLDGLMKNGPNGIVEQAKRYVESARAQLDVAIAEGKVAAAQTRQELEARFEQAKKNPDSARTAFS